MKKALVIIGVIVVLLISATAALAAAEKYTICHAAGRADEPANWVTLTLPYQAVYGQGGHFNENGTPQAGHEQDYEGACENDGGDDDGGDDGGGNNGGGNNGGGPGGGATPEKVEPSLVVTFTAAVDPEVEIVNGDMIDAVGKCFRFDENVTLVLFHYDGRNEVTGVFDGGPHTDWSQYYPAGSVFCHTNIGTLTTPNSGNAFYMMTANGILLTINGESTWEGVVAADWPSGHAFNPVLKGVVAGDLVTP